MPDPLLTWGRGTLNYAAWSIVGDCEHSRGNIQHALGLMMGEGLWDGGCRLYDDVVFDLAGFSRVFLPLQMVTFDVQCCLFIKCSNN